MALERLFRVEHYPALRKHGRKHRRLQIYQLSDVHLGAKTHLHTAFLDVVDKIRRTNHTRWIGHGDLIENNTRTSVGEGVYEQESTPNDQLLELIDILRPIRRKCVGLSRGNHEARTSKSEGVDVVDMLCKHLEIPRLLSHSLHTFHLPTGQSYTLLVTHGRSGASTMGGKINAVEKLAAIYEADGYMYGHVHGLLKWDNIIHGPDGDKLRRFAINGSFMAYIDSYAQESEYKPGIPGYMVCLIGEDGLEFVENRIGWPMSRPVKMGGMKP
mgnify:FL=1